MVYLSACSFLYGARKSRGAEDLTPDVHSQDTLRPTVRFIIQCSVRIHVWECSEYDRVFAVLYGVSGGFATENLIRKTKALNRPRCYNVRLHKVNGRGYVTGLKLPIR